MALQGTLDSFSLPDVLRLLASTTKTGRVRVEGDRGAGTVWMAEGGVVAAEADRVAADPSLVEVVFELLRFDDGEFTFDPDLTTSEAGTPAAVDGLLEEANALLGEWRQIQAVVPSTSVWVSLARELPRRQVTVRDDQWRVLVEIAAGCTVAELASALGLGELGVGRVVKGLVEAGLVAVDGAEDGHEAARAEPPGVAASVEPAAHDRGAERPGAEQQGGDGSNEAGRDDGFDEGAAELARELARLSPEAARAVQAAAEAETAEEREAALAAVDTGDEEIDRGLLLKFLSSVRS